MCEIFSIVSQLFDPRGLLAPYTLIGKNLFTKNKLSGVDWDDTVNPKILEEWQEWLAELPKVPSLHIPRSVKPKKFGQIRTELNHFSDTSFDGIGAYSYIRHMNEDGRTHSSLMLGKSKVIPSQGVITIPRLELRGA